ncbi:hypothetical protein FB45DRAFT_1132538 [Roridomyces roridus]|uniref:FAD-binding FR-type domain-containing protein n=1 Tax=Roridomyces roridus TaxID=1738132 RepID=A0AAD7C4G2_9AGAR|nr:hypothetical protein FB45DRAFT_1132538 [Roridomyces roridus]
MLRVRPRLAAQLTLLSVFGAGTLYLFLPDESRSAPTVENATMSPRHFTRATLSWSQPTGPNTKLLSLVAAQQQKHAPASIWSMFVKDDDIQVERPYTPLQGIDQDGRMLFWVKKYPKGEVGRWLHSKKTGEHIEFRGPLTTWAWKEDTWDEVVMISGGTGIAPFCQLFHSAISRGSSGTRFTLIHASSTSSELPPPEILGPLENYAKENPDKFRLRLFVSKGDNRNDVYAEVGRINKSTIKRSLGWDTPWWRNIWGPSSPPTRKILFLVCGPERLINDIAGPYGRNYSQGEVGGVLAELGFTSKEVVKL